MSLVAADTVNYNRTIALVRRPVRPAFAIGLTVLVALMAVLTIRQVSSGPDASNLKTDFSGRSLSELSPEDIVLMDSTSNMFDESNFSGRVYMLAFYGNNCDGCKAREAQLKKLKSRYMKAPMQLVFVNTGIGSFDDFVAEAKKKKDTRLFDEGKRFTSAMDVTRLPSLMIIDHEGIIRFTAEGDDFDDVEVRSQLDSAIARVPVIVEDPKEKKR